MIYLKNISTPQIVLIPKNRETEGSLVFSIKSTINLSVSVESRVVDLQSVLFIQFSIELPADTATGEYECRGRFNRSLGGRGHISCE